jgi:hypothetical protein
MSRLIFGVFLLGALQLGACATSSQCTCVEANTVLRAERRSAELKAPDTYTYAVAGSDDLRDPALRDPFTRVSNDLRAPTFPDMLRDELKAPPNLGSSSIEN